MIFLACVRCEAMKDAREDVFRDFIVEVKDIECRKNSYIHTAMIMTNILGKSVDVNFTKTEVSAVSTEDKTPFTELFEFVPM